MSKKTQQRLLSCSIWAVLGTAIIAQLIGFMVWPDEFRMVNAVMLGVGLLMFIVPIFMYLGLNMVLARFFYTEIDPVSDDELPSCTVIVPAYNEGAHVIDALQSVFDSDYPEDKLQIFAVDDGSIDDTLAHMKRFAAAHPRVKVIESERNCGKRHALYLGFVASSSETVVTIDSDSTVKRDAVRRMVSPLAVDRRVCAVAGNIRVSKDQTGVFPIMIDASFTVGFEFIRTAQSVFRSVFCTPGALSAYRREAVLPVLSEWLNQTFMGRPAGIGEDRALTNLLMREGGDVVFQRRAIAYTNVPETYKSLIKMLLRWERCNVRENFAMTTYIMKQYRFDDPQSHFRMLTLLVYMLSMITPTIALCTLLFNAVLTKGVLITSFFFAALTWSSISALINLRRHKFRLVLGSYLYGVFFIVALFWVAPYAIITVANGNWLTRKVAGANGKL